MGHHVYRILRHCGCILLNCMPGRLHHVHSDEWSGVCMVHAEILTVLVGRPLLSLARSLHSTSFSWPQQVICISMIGFYIFKPFTFIVIIYIWFFM